jgi:acyl carrier protein
MTTQEQTIEERVIKVFSQVFHKNVDQINRETRLSEDLFAKSLNSMELIAMLENEFDIEIPTQETRRNKTVGQNIDLVERLVKK